MQALARWGWLGLSRPAPALDAYELPEGLTWDQVDEDGCLGPTPESLDPNPAFLAAVAAERRGR